MDENILGKNLRKYRIKCEISQEEAGKYANTTGGAISRYENGTNLPDIKTLIKLADLYSVSLDVLSGRVKEEQYLMLVPGYVAGQMIGDAINRKRAPKRIKKATEQKENPSGNPEGK